MKLSKLTTAILVSAAMLSTVAHSSSLVLTDTSEQKYRYDDQGNPFFSESGISTEQSVIHLGAGEDMPLKMVVELVVPEAWHIAIPNNAVGNLPVVVSGGKGWSHVLREMAEKNEIYTTIDWHSKKVTFDAPDTRKLQMLSAARTMSPQELATEKAELVVAEYERQLASKRSERDSQLIRNRLNQEVMDSTLDSARSSQEDADRLLGKVSSERRTYELENKALQAQLDQAKGMIDALEGKLEVVGLSENEYKPEIEDLFGIYKNANVLPFDSSFDYYIKGGYMDVIEYETPATYIAQPGTLEDVVREWASFNGFELSWKTDVIHKVGHKLVFRGDFRKVGIDLFTLYLESDRPLDIKFYPDIGESGVVIVTDLNHEKIEPTSINWLKN